MNIKILKPIPNHLIDYSFLFGSRTYGTHREDSDYDYLSIVSYDSGDMVLQYKSDRTDTIYTDWKHFHKNIETGASTVNFEVLHTNKYYEIFHDHNDEYLLKYYTTKMAKAYLGYAKRDLEFPDRIFHVNRCLYMADKIMKKEIICLLDIADIKIENDIEVLRSQIKQKREELFNNA